jgi:GDP-L-fucose synthase
MSSKRPTASGVKKIAAMGTGAVYPYPSPGLPLKEDMIFLGKPHPAEDSYAQAKRAMLAMLQAYEESYGIEWVYLVSCNLFGPRDKFDTEFGHVVPSLIKKFHDARQDRGKVTIWGDGSAQRDFLYVKDAALAICLAMENCHGAVNMGSSQVLRIRDIVDMIADITGMAGPPGLGREQAQRSGLSRLRPVETGGRRLQAGLFDSRRP